jgi:hypothetical protein
MALRTNMSRRSRVQAQAIAASDTKRGPLQMLLGLLMLAGFLATTALSNALLGTNLLLINP